MHTSRPRTITGVFPGAESSMASRGLPGSADTGTPSRSLVHVPAPHHVHAHVPTQLIGYRMHDILQACNALIQAQQKNPAARPVVKLPLFTHWKQQPGPVLGPDAALS